MQNVKNNVLVLYVTGATDVKTYWLRIDNTELTKVKRCHNLRLHGCMNTADEEDILTWLTEELDNGKFKDCVIDNKQIVILENDDVPVTVIVTGYAL